MSPNRFSLVRRGRGRARAAVATLAVVAAGLGLAGTAPTTANAAQGTYTTPATTTAFTVPSWVHTININAGGARGGSTANATGGFGSRVVANYPVTPGATLFVTVGKQGGAGGAASTGGGAGAAGGGASFVSTCFSSCTGFGTASDPRVVVAAGGGGAGGNGANGNGVGGGAGGPGAATAPAAGPRCASGNNGSSTAGGGGGGGATCTSPSSIGGTPGAGGTSTVNPGHAGNASGQGGGGGNAGNISGGGGGGGGGYFGGGGGGSGGPFGNGGGGGGAGSSFANPSTTGVVLSPSTGAAPSVLIKYRPSVPTNVQATSNASQSMTVSWQPPDDPGGAATITDYLVQACIAPTGPCGPTTTVSASTRSATFTGLTNGQSYVGAVRAENSVGISDVAFSNAVTPAAVPPGAPTGVTATAGNQSATVTWTPPTDDGGAPITAYSVITHANGSVVKVTDVDSSICSGGSCTTTITGLTNGMSYTFTVTATNSAGTGPESAPSNAVNPHAVAPSAPTNVAATAGNAQATVTWSPPASDGGSPITSYTVTASPGPRTITVNGSTFSATFTGLTNGITYTFTVTATNSAGTGPGASATATPMAGLPGAPTGVTATAGDASANVSWTAPVDNGGAPITSYTVKKCPTSPAAACTVAKTVTGSPPATSTTVTGLTNGTTYVFVVFATNSVGNGPDSGPSNAVTPTASGGGGGSTIYSQSWNAFNAAGWTQSSSSSAPNWHLTSACSANHTAGGGFAWYYGSDSTCTYDNGTTNAGDLMSPAFGNSADNVGKNFVIPTNTPFHMTVFSKRQVESCSGCSHDQTVIHVNYNDGAGWQRIYYADAQTPSSGAYEQLSFTLNSPTGQVQVRFRFNTVSSVLNSFFGWAIDDFAITN